MPTPAAAPAAPAPLQASTDASTAAGQVLDSLASVDEDSYQQPNPNDPMKFFQQVSAAPPHPALPARAARQSPFAAQHGLCTHANRLAPGAHATIACTPAPPLAPTPHPTLPPWSPVQKDTFKQDAILFVGVLLLFYALVQAWAQLFGGGSSGGGFGSF